MHKAKGTNKKEQDSTIKKAVSEKMTGKKRQKNKDREKLHDKKFLGLMKKNFM